VIDAILYAVRDAIRAAPGYGYDVKTCEIMDDGQPPPRCGDRFAAVHQGTQSNDTLNSLNLYIGFAVTLTRRLSNVPLDRVGDRLLAKQLAETNGFNAQLDQLLDFLNMNWGILQDANTNLMKRASLIPTATQVYGFCEPAHFASAEKPSLVGPEWFSAEPTESGAPEMGLKAELRFEGARRMQAMATYV
jgi:hypothetical protein